MKTIKKLSYLTMSFVFLAATACSTGGSSQGSETTEDAPVETMESDSTAMDSMDGDSTTMEMDSVAVEADSTSM